MVVVLYDIRSEHEIKSSKNNTVFDFVGRLSKCQCVLAWERNKATTAEQIVASIDGSNKAGLETS